MCENRSKFENISLWVQIQIKVQLTGSAVKLVIEIGWDLYFQTPGMNDNLAFLLEFNWLKQAGRISY